MRDNVSWHPRDPITHLLSPYFYLSPQREQKCSVAQISSLFLMPGPTLPIFHRKRSCSAECLKLVTSTDPHFISGRKNCALKIRSQAPLPDFTSCPHTRKTVFANMPSAGPLGQSFSASSLLFGVDKPSFCVYGRGGCPVYCRIFNHILAFTH